MTISKNGKIVLPVTASAKDVMNVLEEYGAKNVSLSTSGNAFKSRINFRQKDDEEDRMVIVYENSTYREDGEAVDNKPHTLVMLGAWGEYDSIKASLFSKFSGHEVEMGPFGHTKVEGKSHILHNKLSIDAAKAAADAACAILENEDIKEALRAEFLKVIINTKNEKPVTSKAA